jgi:hypothetical protein
MISINKTNTYSMRIMATSKVIGLYTIILQIKEILKFKLAIGKIKHFN